MEPFAQYTFEPTEFSDVDQDHLGHDGVTKKINPFDIIPMFCKTTVHHANPQSAILDCAKQTLTIANMRPSEWGYQEWGWEGEYGHRGEVVRRRQSPGDFRTQYRCAANSVALSKP